MYRALFEGFGPLATASTRIKLATGLYWLTPDTAANLEQLRKIRNEFAHNPFISGFDESPIVDHLSAMWPAEDPIWPAMRDLWPARESLTNRQLYYVRSVLACGQMVGQLLSAPTAIRMGLPPFSAMSATNEESSSVISEVSRKGLEAITELINPEACRGQKWE